MYNRTRAMSENESFLAISFVVIVPVIIFFVLYNRSFASATLQVSQMSWKTTSTLYHYETDCDWVTSYDSDGKQTSRYECDTESVVDDKQFYNGSYPVPVKYHQFKHTRKDQKDRYDFYGDTVLIVNEERYVGFHPNQSVYESMRPGAYCYGEIGWFNNIRNVDCSGR